MKTKLYSFILLLGAVFASCSDNWTPNLGNGNGHGRLAKAAINVVENENVISRAVTLETFDFIVTVNNAAGQEVGKWSYGSMPELIDLPVGEGYTVKVISHVQEDQAWDKPYYEGESAPFNIVDGMITEIEPITCTFANIAVTITFANDMKDAMSDDSKVTVVANDKGTLAFTKGETRTGYFKALEGSSTLVATFEGTVKGQKVTLRKAYSDVVAKNHYYINYSLKAPSEELPEEHGNITVDPVSGITIDFSVVTDETQAGNVDLNEEILDDNDRPGKEDPKEEEPNPGGDPNDNPGENPGAEDLFTFTSSTIDFSKENEAVAGEPYIIDITSVNPMAHFYVEIDSETLTQDILQDVGLDTEFDLAYPGEFEEGLQGLGFSTGNEVIGQHSLKFDITEFIPLLKIYGSATHKFIMTIVDDKGNKETKTIILKS